MKEHDDIIKVDPIAKDKIVAEAEKRADEVRRRAEAEGRAAGQRAVEQTVERQLAAQLSTLMPALQKAIEDIGHAKQAWLTHWEASAVHLAVAIAERLIRRELPRQPEITLAQVRQALELAAALRRMGEFEPARLGPAAMEYTTLPMVLKKLESRFEDA